MSVLNILDIVSSSFFHREAMEGRPGNSTIRKGTVLLGFEPIAARCHPMGHGGGVRMICVVGWKKEELL